MEKEKLLIWPIDIKVGTWERVGKWSCLCTYIVLLSTGFRPGG